MDGKTRILGIIGNPVEHTMSPVLQNLYAERCGLNLVYAAFPVDKAAEMVDKAAGTVDNAPGAVEKPAGTVEKTVENAPGAVEKSAPAVDNAVENAPADTPLARAVRGARALHILGLNVTVPFKTEVIPYLREVDRTALDIGAVNTLVETEGGYKGYNTDAAGLRRAVREAGFTPGKRTCVLIGAGGAARAAAYMMMQEGAEHIWLLNRSGERARELAAWAREVSGKEMITPLPMGAFARIPGEGWFVVQATSVGMNPRAEAAPVEDPAFYGKVAEAVDCIYTPLSTRFMRQVEAAGGRAVNGLRMLLYQGIASFELWNPGAKVPDETVAEAERLIKERLT